MQSRDASGKGAPGWRAEWRLTMLAAALLLGLDQGVKWIVATYLPLGDRIVITEWFNLGHVLNPGAAFSFLADAGGWQRHVLSVIEGPSSASRSP